MKIDKEALYNLGGILSTMVIIMGISGFILIPLLAVFLGNYWVLLFLLVSGAAIYLGLIGQTKMIDKLYPGV
jgi:hypothetical protein